MAITTRQTLYIPVPTPVVDPGRFVTRDWVLLFEALVARVSGTLPAGVFGNGTIPLTALQDIHSPGLLGRGSSGDGPVEQITLGTGLTMTDTVLHVSPDLSEVGYWTPITNGDPLSPEILFDAEGDCVVGFVPTP